MASMAATVVEYTVEKARRSIWLVGGAVLTVGFFSYLVFLALNWPFKEQRVIDVLQEATLRTVTIDRFQKTFFPLGCVAEGVKFEHHVRKDQPPIIYIQTLTARASYWSLLTAQYRLSEVKAVQMHILVPPPIVHGKPDPLMPLNRSNAVHSVRIDKIIADGAVLDFAHEDGAKPYRMVVDKLAAYDITNNSAISYKTVVTNSVPPGKILSSGVFGPWRPNHVGLTPVRGTYTLQDTNLAAFQNLSGTLQAQGHFAGNLGEIQTKGTAEVKNFRLADTSHSRDLKTTFVARVDGTKGDTLLDEVHAEFDRSSLTVKGSIAGEKGAKGKAISLDLDCTRGRIEDMLDLFIAAKTPPLLGAIQMKGHVDAPPGTKNFLQKMRLSGDFGVDKGKLTNKTTQADLNRLSASAEKNEAAQNATALSDLKGHAEVSNGIATLTHTTLSIPGATTDLSGTYNLINYDINLHGYLYTDGKPWTAQTGFKSLLARAITPFLKKKQNVRIVPIKITGNYDNINVGLDLGQKK